jgi:hypothetical protein
MNRAVAALIALIDAFELIDPSKEAETRNFSVFALLSVLFRILVSRD